MADAAADAAPSGSCTPAPERTPADSAAAASSSSLPDADADASEPPAPTDDAARQASIEQLRLLLSQLHGVKRKLADVSRTEADDCARCKARLEHLSSASAARPAAAAEPQGGLIPWTRQRLDILLVDHLLRSGHHDTATRLAASSDITRLTDGHIFAGARRVLDALLQGHDVGPALAWCAEHRGRLAKAKSGLEFKLHVQRFIELVRARDRAAAIAYARAHLAPWAGQYMGELQRAIAALVFFPPAAAAAAGRSPPPAPYRQLFDEGAWRSLADLFLRDLLRLHSLTPESLLNVHLQAGLSALKTPASGEPGGSREDPLRLPAFRALAEALPYAKHMHSKLLCAVTRELMSDANPPVVLPNGMVYSQRGVEQLMAQHAAEAGAGAAAGQGQGGGNGGGSGGGVGVCPATGMVFRREDLRRAFIA